MKLYLLHVLNGLLMSAASIRVSYVATFLKSIETVRKEITSKIPGWYDYEYDTPLGSSIQSGGMEMFNEGNKVKYLKDRKDGPGTEYDPIAYDTTYSSAKEHFDIGSRAIHPFVMLMWVRGGADVIRSHAFTVESRLGGDSFRSYRDQEGSIRSYGLNVTFRVFQAYGGTSGQPTVCEVYFHVAKETWKSVAGKVMITDIKNGPGQSFRKVEISSPAKNVLLAYMLLSQKEGAEINNTSVQQAVETAVKSFQHVLCNPYQTACSSTEFDCRCGNDIYKSAYPERHCIPSWWRCDGIPDCPDGRDEKDCLCGEGFLQCGGSRGGKYPVRYQCVPNSRLCDGIDDCDNFRDERVNQCAFNCSSEETIRLSKQCDGIIDCPDGSDERNCSNCPADRPHRCAAIDVSEPPVEGTVSCFTAAERCDGIKHCSDFSDEINCTCPSHLSLPCRCNNEHFNCSGQFSCFSPQERCDFTRNCGDGSDEADCVTASCPGERPMPCDCNQYDGSTCVGDPCYSKEDICDGWVDCSDWSDEKNCSCPSDLPLPCGCRDSEGTTCGVVDVFTTSQRNYSITFGCYSEWDACDRMEDCPDNSDETCEECPTVRPISCACKESGNCDSSSIPCYTTKEECDGTFDCSDRSDEWNCDCSESQLKKCPCKELQTVNVCVGSQSCYDINETCDQIQHCMDWGDEYNCDITDQNTFRCGCDRPGNVTCNGKPFYTKEERCDGSLDCPDGKDEADCSPCPDPRSRPCACGQNNRLTCDGRRPCYFSEGRCDGKDDCGDWSDEWNCPSCHSSRPHVCDCARENRSCDEGPQCYKDEDACDGVDDCSDGTDERNCNPCPSFRNISCTCHQDGSCEAKKCFSHEEKCDGVKDCEDGTDEWGCDCPSGDEVPCQCKLLRNKEVCVGEKSCFDDSNEKCNSFFDCDDSSDEWNCPCPSLQPVPCECKLRNNTGVCIGSDTCFAVGERCNAVKKDCQDGSDERNCLCGDDMFTCDCFKRNDPVCSQSKGCIAAELADNGVADCPDTSDETHLVTRRTTSCGGCQLVLFRLDSIEACRLFGPAICNVSTCVTVPARGCVEADCSETNAICTSPCEDALENCNTIFQCEDQTLIMGFRFCDGVTDCPDGSDETTEDFGFSCQQSNDSLLSCILPQWNLYDEDTAQCFKELDVCSNEENQCFQCFDNKLKIAINQVCDGIIDCRDTSDECLCRSNFDLPFCQDLFVYDDPNTFTCGRINSRCDSFTASHIIGVSCPKTNVTISEASLPHDSRMQCKTKFGPIIPKLCDGRPECDDFIDECSICDPKPEFCKSLNQGQCSSFYNLGDRYCDGTEDDVYKFLQDPVNCPKGFDEMNCTTRFRCPSGRFISIDVDFVGDGVINCDDGSDENFSIFSSATEMISNPVIRYAIWIIAAVTLCGNSYVIITTSRKIKTKKLRPTMLCNHLLILNLAMADFLMGIYLLMISVQSVIYKNVYGQFDFIWRGSPTCTAAGCLAILSSETSCFLMSVLTTFRFINVLNPVKSIQASTKPWKLAIALVWILSLLLAVTPALPQLSDYFVYQASFDSPYSKLSLLNKSEIISFSCRHATLSNVTLIDRLRDTTWDSITVFMAETFPEYKFNRISFYGETSLCMPRFYVDLGDPAWEFSFVIITVNFISFMYVCVGYIVLYKVSSNRPVEAKRADAANMKMQRRIARLLITDFLCWIPVCIIAYIKLSTGLQLSNDVYAVTIAFLLPINSALNPLLYSPFFDKIIDKYICNRCNRRQNSSSVQSTSTAYSQSTKL